MPIVDRSILRLAVYEMMFVGEVPTSVCINEAIELAKDFGGEDESPRFVNGVLGRIARRLEGSDEPSGEDGAADSAETACDAASEDAEAESASDQVADAGKDAVSGI